MQNIMSRCLLKTSNITVSVVHGPTITSPEQTKRVCPSSKAVTWAHQTICSAVAAVWLPVLVLRSSLIFLVLFPARCLQALARATSTPC
jgi:hypothetical protein